jgi:hypothetical protein
MSRGTARAPRASGSTRNFAGRAGAEEAGELGLGAGELVAQAAGLLEGLGVVEVGEGDVDLGGGLAVEAVLELAAAGVAEGGGATELVEVGAQQGEASVAAIDLRAEEATGGLGLAGDAVGGEAGLLDAGVHAAGAGDRCAQAEVEVGLAAGGVVDAEVGEAEGGVLDLLGDADRRRRRPRPRPRRRRARGCWRGRGRRPGRR